MHPLIKRNVKRAKLVYLWITRILLAKSHFKVPLHTRLRYAIFGGFVADQYVLYDLKRNSRSEYLSEFDWYRSRWINEPFDSMLNNKIVCNEVLEDHVDVPPILFVKNKGRLFSTDRPESKRPISEVVASLREHGAMFLKPLGSGKGKGVHRLDAAEGGFMIDRRPATEREVIAFLEDQDGWFLSLGVEQHPVLSTIFPETTNTIRLITMRDPETGAARVFFAVLRIGTAATIPVDNGSRGGLVSLIDLEEGTLSAARPLWSPGEFSTHPDSGEQIEGVELPGWRIAKQRILDVAGRFPYLQFVAWDVLLTEQGPCVIEANTSSGVNIIQMWGAQRQGELGDFYRAHGVIK
ncbi:sugar-transfer associated ATP-grasp domain-containing protein [Leucobacter tenebrionis]|uniref:sugar-transfer associated ATP-grasp domain-containing protein n=1 Tax=Leucobacter tenebrionis TaxID=2873270 RepID=UPI001CA60613|nr:sugar-transfer associated ATP-grasp domain-containing protein [Leucobacter tenebrionis]QZY53115.1 hypothetical protein KVY00_06750 [Leucobacter tenebrionis]